MHTSLIDSICTRIDKFNGKIVTNRGHDPNQTLVLYGFIVFMASQRQPGNDTYIIALRAFLDAISICSFAENVFAHTQLPYDKSYIF